MSWLSIPQEEYRPQPPAQKDYAIGLIGCGGIAQGAHLPAYRNFGYRVVAACDLLEENLRAVQERFGVPWITTDLDAFLDHPEVEIIDLAVHGYQRRPIVERICAHRPPKLRGILSQKPFAMNWEDAVAMVQACEAAGIPLMVNQQARWAPAHRFLKRVIESGVLGHLYAVTHFHRSFQDQPGSWFVRLENFNIVDHGIHYIDLCRYFTGKEPIRVKATATMQPGQAAVSPMCHVLTMEFPPEDQVMAVSYFNNIVRTPTLHRYEWFADGTEGSAMVSQNEARIARRDRPDEVLTVRIHGAWFPDAFGGSMGELMAALTEGREPQTSGRDNLKSIRIAYAAVESVQTGAAVPLDRWEA